MKTIYRGRRSALLFLPPAFLFVLLFLLCRAYTVDDAFITYTYCKHILTGQGPVFTPGQYTEGFTSPLHVLLLLAAANSAHLVLAAKVIGCVSGLLLLAYVYRSAGLLTALLLTAVPAFAICAANGLETMLYALLLTIFLLTRFWRPQPLLGQVAMVLLVWVRPEGIALVLFALALDLWARRSPARLLRDVLLAAGAFLLLLGLRYHIYGQWLPNTYYAKAAAGSILGRAGHGLVYVLKGHIKLLFIPLVLVCYRLFHLPADPARRRRIICLFLCLAGYLAIVVYEGGDWIPFDRFLVPILPVYFVLAFAGRPASRGVALLALVLVLCQAPVGLYEFGYVRDRAKGYSHAHRYLARFLDSRQPAPLVALMDIGMVAFYSDCRVIDLMGLTDRHIARARPFSPDYVLKQQPDYVVLVASRSYARGFASPFARDRLLYRHPLFAGRYAFLFERNHFLYINSNQVIRTVRKLFAPLSSEAGFAGYFLLVFARLP